jgi:hypothetical protein
VYSRQIEDVTYTFEPSGGLLNASLVMQDRETDSYWSITTERAIHGAARGQKLRKLPGAEKTTWGAWRKLHPQSKVLSVEGVEHEPQEAYADYFGGESTFRNMKVDDKRLEAKELIYVFHHGGQPMAIPHTSFVAGAVAQVGEQQLFLYREQEDSFYRSTAAFLVAKGAQVERLGGSFVVRQGEHMVLWNSSDRRFDGETSLVEPFEGFDTYWYIWSLTNKKTEILKGVTVPAKSKTSSG